MPKRIFYTFGNHMHWVDMEWLWGYHVLPGSVRDMIRLCKEAGVKGNVNFDVVGYEKLSHEDPEAFAELREAVRSGLIEPVGCSYAQPYGLFHGGESNIRQRVYGVRSAMRLFGIRPRTFWEEEFDCFPQLPQMLKGCGFSGASLFFQWTWHTPEVPTEADPIVLWEGVDGTRMPAATRNNLNLHQWPEDFDGLLDNLAASPEDALVTPLVLQWLELMPSKDWMCRSELLLPRLKELMADERFDVQACTLGEYLAMHGCCRPGTSIFAQREVSTESQMGSFAEMYPDLHFSHFRPGMEPKRGEEYGDPQGGDHPWLPVRRYTMGDLWHGMSLGKNEDYMRTASAETERRLLEAETLAAMMSLFGRPYAQWDVYPVWQLEEGWRSLLVAQHHDIDECEGLCANQSGSPYDGPGRFATPVSEAQSSLLRSRYEFDEMDASSEFICNTLGLPCTSQFGDLMPAVSIAPRGILTGRAPRKHRGKRGFTIKGTVATFEYGSFRGVIDLEQGLINQIYSEHFPDGVLREPLAAFHWSEQGSQRLSSSFRSKSDVFQENSDIWVQLAQGEREFNIGFDIEESMDAISMSIYMPTDWGRALRPDPGMGSGFRMPVKPTDTGEIFVDMPYQVDRMQVSPPGCRKYPSGDWMTSEQWYEQIDGAFTGQSFVDFCSEDGSRGLMIAYTGTKQWFQTSDDFECLLSMFDPWDEHYLANRNRIQFYLFPHGRMTHAQRWKTSAVLNARTYSISVSPRVTEFPEGLTLLDSEPDNVVVTAFYREVEDFAGKGLSDYAGKGMGYPFVIRLVEFDGEPAEVCLRLPKVDRAFKTNLMGEIEEALTPHPCANPNGTACPERLREWTELRFKMRPREIATVYADLIAGRKEPRDLDAKRAVWATAHKR